MTRRHETFSQWNVLDDLKSEEQIAAYLEACAEENDPAFMDDALESVARARELNRQNASTPDKL